MNLGKNIYTLRKKIGLSQEQLAEKVNVTRQTISNWELGETFPNPEQLKLLSVSLGVSIDDLVENVEFITNKELLQNNNINLKSKRYKAVLLCYFLCSIVWCYTAITNFIENNISFAIIDLALFFAWIIITTIWYNKKQRK